MTSPQINSSNLFLKPVGSLLKGANNKPAEYWIPAYQRGYRWSTLQVKQLLDDIWQWENISRKKRADADEFYCLQPLVIKANDGRYEVVDGQQRLTTILLILNHFNRRLVEDARKQLFSITFQTRPSLDVLLAKPIKELEEEAKRNVDFYHVYQATQQIRAWFEENPGSEGDMESALLLRTQVIWFELAEKDNPVDAFTRLNVGKIPLTDDELIRALFLRQVSPNKSDDLAWQLKVANEWDQIEKALQNNAFWYFLTNSAERAQNRIGFLFELLAQSDGIPPEALHDKNKVFYAFSKRMDGVHPEKEWQRIKDEFVRLQEWYEDESRVLYHIVGFLVDQGTPLARIRDLSKESTKSSLDRKLRRRVFEEVIGTWPGDDPGEEELRDAIKEKLGNLEYGAGSAKIRSILLLFNIATLLLNSRSNLLFQFSSYKTESWDLEHVRSVSADRLGIYKERVTWMKACLRYLVAAKLHADLQAEIQAFLDLPQREVREDNFELLYDKVLKKIDESADEEPDNSIANLTLLDASTNRSYKNAPFVVKRQKLLSLDEAGTFVPLCTRNVFLKCYSPLVDNPMVWSAKDKKGYERAIVDTLVSFFLGRTEELV